MNIDKQQIIEKHCYTTLVYGRINKKLKIEYTNLESEQLITRILKETNVTFFEKIGKNFYITNKEYRIKITINSNTFRIITVDKI